MLIEGRENRRGTRLNSTLRNLLGASTVLLFITLLLLWGNAYSPDILTLRSLQVSSVLFVSSCVAATFIGLLRAWRTRTDLRSPIVFITILTLVVLSSHLYAIDSPPKSRSSVLSTTLQPNPVSTGDGHLIITQYALSSSSTGSSLSMTIQVKGEEAISSLRIQLANQTLPSSSLAPAPSEQSPLLPAQETQGSWVLPSSFDPKSAHPLDLSYDYLTCYDTSKRVYGCVMDEIYYVPASQNILSGNQCAPYQDNCNLEHPFLGKTFIAAGIAAFGFSVFGWRFFQVLLGTASVPLLFAIVMRLSNNRKMAYYSSLLLAADTMFFAHSGSALIDVQPVFFALVAFLVYLLNLRFWKIDGFLLAGIFMGLAGLSKETAIFLFAALLTYNTLLSGGRFRDRILSSLKMVFAGGAVFFIGLQVFDSLYVSAAFPTFLQDVGFILKYGSGLTGSGWTDPVLKAPITPLNWLTFYSPVGYLLTHVTATISAGSSQLKYVYTEVGYYGITNMLVVWTVFAWVPSVLYQAFRRWKQGNPEGESTPESLQAALFAFVWFAWTYFPYLALWIYGRVTYPFYFLPSIPALAIGASYFISRSWFSSKIALVYLLAVFGWFFLFYPDKSFLPIWLRGLLGK